MTNIRAYLACIFIVCAWSGWITISRYGVHSNLQPADITLIRYVTALICVSPLIVRYSWARFKLHQYLVMALGVGFPYTMVTFYGLKELKAAHAGVLVNGMLPVLGAVAAWFILRHAGVNPALRSHCPDFPCQLRYGRRRHLLPRPYLWHPSSSLCRNALHDAYDHRAPLGFRVAGCAGRRAGGQHCSFPAAVVFLPVFSRARPVSARSSARRCIRE